MAIVAALAGELRPLLQGWTMERSSDGVHVYSSERAVAAFAGMGKARAELAASAALEFGPVHQILSAGWAGGLHPRIGARTVRFAEAVVDAASGEIFGRTDAVGGGVTSGAILVTLDHVASATEKHWYHERYSADMVDMEASAVASVAAKARIPFLALKAISDEYDFEVPGIEKFATADGGFREAAFAAHVALRPGMWRPVMRLARNSAAGARHLCAELERYLNWHAEAIARNGTRGDGVGY